MVWRFPVFTLASFWYQRRVPVSLCPPQAHMVWFVIEQGFLRPKATRAMAQLTWWLKFTCITQHKLSSYVTTTEMFRRITAVCSENHAKHIMHCTAPSKFSSFPRYRKWHVQSPPEFKQLRNNVRQLIWTSYSLTHSLHGTQSFLRS